MKVALRSFGSANRFIRSNNLWHFVYIPGVLNIILFYFSFNWFIDNVANWINGMFEFNCEDAYLPWLCSAISVAAGLLQFFVKWFLHIAFIGLYLSVYKSILLILYSPVLAYLVDILDKKHKGLNEPFRMEQFIRDTVRGVVLAIRGFFLEGGAIFILFLLALIPIVNLIQPILFWFVSAYFLGVSMLDYTLEKRGMNVKESINYTKKNKSLAAAIGSVFQLIFLIPFLGWMIAPTYSVIAAYFAVEELGNIEN